MLGAYHGRIVGARSRASGRSRKEHLKGGTRPRAMRETFGALLITVLLVGAACGNAESSSPPGGQPRPDSPVTSTPGTDEPDPSVGKAMLVKPRAGQSDVRKVGFEKAKVLGPRKLKVFFWSGVEPCQVLDHVAVSYHRKEVIVRLFEGYDPSAKDQACIEIAVYKATVVRLEEPLGDRKIVDGAIGTD